MGDQRATKVQQIESQSRSLSPPVRNAAASHPHPLLRLQRQIGNHAVTQQLQAKMTVGAANDVHEQEADRVANTVMRMAEPEPPSIQRQPEEKLQAKSNTTPAVSPGLESRIQSMRGGGQPLAPASNSFFSSRMGYDFSNIRIHADAQAGEVAGNLQAQAFAIGRNIFFAPGRYEPQTVQGKWLLAHELTHTIQQNAVTAPNESPSLAPSEGNLQRKVSSPGAAKDPGFQAVAKQIKATAQKQKHHEPAHTKATAAQAAALPPSNDVASKAAGKQVQQMDQQQPKPFDRKAFKAALLTKIAAAAPKNLEEADNFKESGKVASVKGELTGQVDSSKQASGGAIAAQVKGTPNLSGIPTKAVAALPPNAVGPAPGAIDAKQAAPKPKSAAEISLQAGSQSLDQQMASAEVTDDQLKKSNEPDFQGALTAKKEAQTDTLKAPQQYRQGEQTQIAQAQAQAATTTNTQIAGMHSGRGQTQSKTTTAQQVAKQQDEQKRAEVANELQNIYTQTKKSAEEQLARLDTEVNQVFDRGATSAQQAFENYVDQRMRAYKNDRYGGVGGSILWLKDKLLGLPSEVNLFYEQGRKLYIAQMDGVLDRVAMQVEQGLNQAKAEIARGRQAIAQKLNEQPANLRKALAQDAQKIQGQFDQLEQTVDAKQDQLIHSLAQKYNEKLQTIDARIDEMKAQNKGLVDAAIDAVGGVIKAILELKNMLLGVLAKAAAAIKKIIKDPIGFLGNLVAGVKQGFMNFIGNIGTHLQKGLMGWLFGALAEAGIQLPDSFDLKGILSLILQVLGATWTFIRARAVNILGEKVVKAMETGAEIFQILMTKGIGGVWEYIKEQISHLKDVVVDGIKSFVTDSIIKAGVTWIIGLLNPAGAFIKACKAIYDVIMFFVERGSQIVSLVNAVVDSVSAIADGAIGVAASAVENALSKALPVAISFLAALLGVTGITEKIRDIIGKVQAPVHKAIDWLVNKAYNLVKAAGKLLGFGKSKDDKPDEHDDLEKQKKIDAGIKELREEEVRHTKNGQLSFVEAKQLASLIKSKHPIFQQFNAFEAGNHIKYRYTASPPIVINGPEELSKHDVNASDIEVPETVPGEKEWDMHIFANITDSQGNHRLLWVDIQIPMDPELKIPKQPPSPSMVIEGRVPIDGEKKQLRLNGGSITEYALKLIINRYQNKFGNLNEIDGSLTDDNKSLYQMAYASLRSKGVDEDTAKQEAIKKTPFGKYRIKLGYDKFDIKLKAFEWAIIPKLDPDPTKRFFVPTTIHAIARR
jgi:hypothetical protein